MKREELLLKARSLPEVAGCYLMKDKSDKVLYIGKAKKLRQRVSSYFQKNQKSLKTEYLVKHIENFDFILTNSDAESYILENNLIKKHTPKYNIRLRDDKTYPFIQINLTHDYPRMEFVRKVSKNKNFKIFGPFPQSFYAQQLLKTVIKAFRLRDCSDFEFKSRKDPCLLYQLKQCSAPCMKFISKVEYQRDLNFSQGVFLGLKKRKEALEYLKILMNQKALKEEFEEAGIIRDCIRQIEEMTYEMTQQKVEFLKKEENLDVWSAYIGDEEIDISLYMIRNAMVLGSKNYHFRLDELVGDLEEEVLGKIYDYYQRELPQFLPQKIIIQTDCELDSISSALNIKVYNGGSKYESLLEMVKSYAKESQILRQKLSIHAWRGLDHLKVLLSLPERPRKIECFDVAIWQGDSPTASKVVFEDGIPLKSEYRSYHLSLRPEGNNDFAMMREALMKRFTSDQHPDLLVIDGGKAQVNIALKVLSELGLSIPVVGIAKAKELTSGNFREPSKHSDERLIIPGRVNPVLLYKYPDLFKLIVSLRDEAHRFSRRLHHKQEKKRVLKSWLDEIKGVGSKTKEKILRNLKISKEELGNKSFEELSEILGVEPSKAKIIFNYLKSN